MHLMKKVNALQLRQSLGAVIDDLEKTGEPILIEKGRKPVGVLISLQDFKERFHELDAAAERDKIIAEMDAIAAKAPIVDPRSGLEILRELRGYQD